MTINDVYELCLYILNKFQGGGLTPTEFNRVINVAQRSYMSWLLGTMQTYQPGRPIAQVELGNNASVRQRLTPSIYEYNLAVNADGFSPYPGDFLQVDAMWNIYGFDRVRWVGQDRWYSTANSVIDPVATNPIYRIRDVGLFFLPLNIGAAKMSYVRNPPDMVWAFTLDGNQREVYDPANSVQPIWDDLSILDIIVRALRIIGVNLQADQVSQYATEIKQTGQ